MGKTNANSKKHKSRNKQGLGLGVIFILSIFCVSVGAAGVIVPVVLAKNNKTITPEFTGDGKDLVKQIIFTKQSDGSYKGKLEVAEGKNKDDIKTVGIKVGNKILVKDTDYTISDSFDIVIKAGVINDNDNVTIEITKKASYTINVKTEAGGSVEGGGVFKEGASVTVTATPDVGYSFAGWYENDIKISGADAKYTFDIINNRDLIAKFTINKYTVTFDTDGGTKIDSQIVEYGNYATKPENNPVKEDLVFDGWYTTKEGNTKFDFDDTQITADTTIYAHYAPKYTTLKFTIIEGTTNVSVNTRVDMTISGSLVIPTKVEGKFVEDGVPTTMYTITKIEMGAFYHCASLTSIKIPNTVELIDGIIFCNCPSLETIIIESGNTKYDSRNNCNAIIETSTNTLINGCKKSTIPSTVTSIGNYAFMKCSGLTSIDIPEGVTTIGERAFDSTPLSSINIPNSVTSINNFAFCDCKELSGVTIDKNNSKLNSIGDYAFWNCSNLTSMTIPNSVNQIGYAPFEACSSLTSIEVGTSNTIYNSNNNCNAIIKTATNELIVGCKNTTIPDTVTSIGEGSFNGCTSLTSITIPSAVESIKNIAFNLCSSLKTVSFNSNSNLKYINESAFKDCSSLTSITIPNKVSSIGVGVFNGCSSLNSFVVESGNTIYDSRNNCNAIIKTTENELIAGCKNTTIPDTVTSIGMQAFQDISSLTSITIPSSVTSIKYYAFKNCSSLSSVTISNKTKIITGSSGMFLKCSLSSGSIKVPNSLLEDYKKADYWSDYKDYMVGYDA